MNGTFRRFSSMVTLAVGAAIALSATACDGDDPTGVGDDFDVSPITSDANIFALTHESNLGEIQAGQVAQQRASDVEVQAFAQRMITEHTTLDQEGTALAQQLAVTPVLPDSNLPRLQQQELAQLSAVPAGGAFDQQYIAQQITAHQRTLALVDASIERAQAAELRAALQSRVRPHVAAHLETAQDIQGRIGEP